MHNLNEHAAENICKILIGNKFDIAVEKREVSAEEGQRLATKNSIKFFECSAKLDQMVNESFLELTQEIMKNHDTSVRDREPTIPKPRANTGSKKCCK